MDGSKYYEIQSVSSFCIRAVSKGFPSSTGLGSSSYIQIHQNWMSQNSVQVLQWPTSSADLSPIQSFWDIIKDYIETKSSENIKELMRGNTRKSTFGDAANDV